MKIITKKTLEVTAPLATYIEEKLGSLEKFMGPFEKEGETTLRLEVSRTSEHHRKGDEVFMAVANLDLPGKVLRSEASASDIRVAIDKVRTTLHMEIEKYKTKREEPSRGREK